MIKFFHNFVQDNRRLFQTSAGFLLFILSFSTSFAQSRAAETNTVAGNEEIHGTVKFPPGDTSGVSATVILRSLSSPEIKGVTNSDGEFRFTHLRPDTYTIIVDAGDAYEKATETVSVGFSGSVPAQGNPFSYSTPAVYEVRIYVQPKGLSRAAGEVPGAPIRGAAKKRFHQALEDQRAGKHSRAIESLKMVIVEATNFTPAYVELGKEYLRIGEGQLAIDTFEKALKIDPNSPVLRLNYGIALLNQKQFPAAETEMRLSIEKGKEYSLVANYYLGLALLAEHKFDEARTIFEDVVKKGGDRLPLAHKYLGGIYLQEKQYRRAADELNTYLKLEPKAADAEKIRETISESRSKS
jgi:Tfp pilus assembly protein PilF